MRMVLGNPTAYDKSKAPCIVQEENKAMSKMLRQSPGTGPPQKPLEQPSWPIPADSDANPSGFTPLDQDGEALSGLDSEPAAAHAGMPVSRAITEGVLKGQRASADGPGWDALPPGLQRLLPRPLHAPGMEFCLQHPAELLAGRPHALKATVLIIFLA